MRRTRAARVGERLRVYWDRSLSRRDDRLKDELSLLDKYLAQAKPASIDLVIFNSSGARVRRAAPGEIAGILRGVLYRGATSFAVLEKLEAPEADTCLVFSDGVVTIDARRDFKPGCQRLGDNVGAGCRRRIPGAADAPERRRGSSTRPPAAKRKFLSRSRPGARVIEARGEDGERCASPAWMRARTECWWSARRRKRAAWFCAWRVSTRYARASICARSARSEKFAGAGALWAADRVALLAAEDGAPGAARSVTPVFGCQPLALVHRARGSTRLPRSEYRATR